MAEDDARALTQAVDNLTRVVTNLDELLRRDYPKRAEIEHRYTSKQASRRIVQGLAIVLAIILLSAYFNVRLGQQQACFERRLQESSAIGAKRSALVEEETAQNKALWLIFAEAAGLLKNDPTKPLSKADQDRLNTELVKQLLQYKSKITRIESEREQLPVEPYRPGSC